MSLPSPHSPLMMVLNAPEINEFIQILQNLRQQAEKQPTSQPLHLNLSSRFIASVQQSFKTQILQGEYRLHQLSQALCQHFFKRGFELHSNVIGLLPDGNRPFLIREKIDEQLLLSLTDVDLGNHLLNRFRYEHNQSWKSLELSANYVEYIPKEKQVESVNRVTSRVKAEEEIWNKVTDEIFQIDDMIQRDKELRLYSKFVKDVFGVKIIGNTEADCEFIQQELIQMSSLSHISPDGQLSQFPFTLIETKDYLFCPPEKRKKTGWKAIKNVVIWNQGLFEIQIQPLVNYYMEIDHMSGSSHQSFRLQREKIRKELAHIIPLYQPFRDLIRTIFFGDNFTPPTHGFSIQLTD